MDIKEALHELNEEIVSREEFEKYLKRKYKYFTYIDLTLQQNFKRTKLAKFPSFPPFLILNYGKNGYNFKAYYHTISSKDVCSYFFTPKALENLTKIMQADISIIEEIDKQNLLPLLTIITHELQNSFAGSSTTVFFLMFNKQFDFGSVTIPFNFNSDGKFINMNIRISFKEYSLQPFDTEVFDSQIEAITSTLSEFDNYMSSVNNALENFDMTILDKGIEPLKASHFNTIKLSDIENYIKSNIKTTEVNEYTKEEIKKVNEAIFENPELDDLLITLNERNLIDFICIVLKQDIPSYLTVMFSFWQNWLKEIFDLDIFKFDDWYKIVKLTDKSVQIENKILTLPAPIYDIKNLKIANINSAFIVPEGITSLSNLKIASYNSFGYLILPSSLVGQVDFSKIHKEFFLGPNPLLKIVITPIKNEEGELVSPFVTNASTCEKFKDRILFLEQ